MMPTLTSFMSIIFSTLTLLLFSCTQLMTTMLHRTLPLSYLLFRGIKCHLSLFWVPHSRELLATWAPCKLPINMGQWRKPSPCKSMDMITYLSHIFLQKCTFSSFWIKHLDA
jgi:hypothetical protein